MATSDALKICTNAMVLIGADSVVSFTDGTSEAETASALYERTLRSCLTEHRWNFTVDQFELSKTAAKPKAGFSLKYLLPSPILVMDKVWPENLTYELFNGKEFHTSYDGQIIVDGVWRVDEANMPDYFIEYLEFRLAAKFAWPITSDMTLASKMEDRAMFYQKNAKSADSKQRKNVGLKGFTLVEVRG